MGRERSKEERGTNMRVPHPIYYHLSLITTHPPIYLSMEEEEEACLLSELY
jgi:hypothetical protein